MAAFPTRMHLIPRSRGFCRTLLVSGHTYASNNTTSTHLSICLTSPTNQCSRYHPPRHAASSLTAECPSSTSEVHIASPDASQTTRIHVRRAAYTIAFNATQALSMDSMVLQVPVDQFNAAQNRVEVGTLYPLNAKFRTRADVMSEGPHSLARRIGKATRSTAAVPAAAAAVTKTSRTRGRSLRGEIDLVACAKRSRLNKT